MICVQQVCEALEAFAPSRLAEDWDNVGLLVGRADAEVRRIMTCLTATRAVVEECRSQQVDLLVTHHPLPFRPLKRLTSQTTTGELLLQVIESRVAVYSPHTAFDSAAQGINQSLAELLELQAVGPLVESQNGEPGGDTDRRAGAGRWGVRMTPVTMHELVAQLKQSLQIGQVQVAGEAERPVSRVAVACGSAGSFLEHAVRHECELFVTGETGLHTVLEAEAQGIGLVLVGHYASERFAVERLAQVLSSLFPAVEIWASRAERDPLRWL